MMPSHDPRLVASSGLERAPRLLAMLALGLAACVASEPQGGAGQNSPPTVSLSPGTASDSLLTFTISATDNLGLLHVDAVAFGPGLGTACDTTFNSAVTSYSRTCTINVPSAVPIGTTVTILGQSVDGNNNISPVDTIFMVVGGGTPAQVRITQPVNLRDTVPVGFNDALSISGRTTRKVRTIGWIVTGAINYKDSVIFASPLKDSLSLDTALVFVGAVPGTAIVTPFMYDSLNTYYTGNPVSVIIVASAGANTTPVVDFGITKRVEVTDTIHVKATDRAGIRWLGYVIRQMPPGNAIIAEDSIQIVGNVTTAIHTFGMNLPIVVFPTTVRVEAWATNTTGKQDSAHIPTGNAGPVRNDTVIVVAGLTRPLPNGGQVADALYHPPTNRIYLSNIQKNQLEVFDLGDSSFHVPIPTGSRPWGIAGRPADHTGLMTDTLIVANNGGTLLSFVDVNIATAHEVYRYALPNIIFQTCTSALLFNTIVEHCTVHDFSDRPQYVAATCQGLGLCGDLVVAYTTSPTEAQAVPFTNKGTIRYENITQKASHFFFEQAIGQGDAVTVDTIQIERFQSAGYGSDSLLVPFIQGPFYFPAPPPAATDTSYFSVTTNTPLVAFRDTTFARNSGNFARAAFGEGGAIAGQSGQPNARTMSYDVNVGMIPAFVGHGHLFALPVPVIDGGVSRPGDVSDFVVNTATPVTGIAINFDGATIGVRADSTYLINNTLRLQGLLQTSGGNVGLDFHPQNSGLPRPGGTGGTQMMFTSSAQPEIDVWNTNNYQLCLVVPTRDPVIGPIKSALVAGGSTMLVGATQFGVVVVTIPQAQMAAACP